MRNYFLLMLVMISVAEVIFSVFYIYLSQRVGVVAIVGALLYLVTATRLYACYRLDQDNHQREMLIKTLLEGSKE